MGEMNKYVADEQKPVAKDVANYMIDGTREQIVQTVKEIKGESYPICPTCGTKNEPNAQFCDNCGTPLSKICSQCGEQNDSDANFCRKCGKKL